MDTIILKEIYDKNKIIRLLLISSIGIIAGIFYSFIVGLSYVYVILIEMVLFMAIVAVLTGQTKRILLAILIVTIPININKYLLRDSNHIGGVSGLVISVWFIILIFLYTIWFGERWADKKQKVHYFPSVTIPVGLLLLISVLSMIKSVAVHLSIFQIIQMIKVVLLFFYIGNNIKTENDYKFILYVLFATLIFEIWLGYYQYFLNDYVDLGIISDIGRSNPRELGYQSIMPVSGTLTGDARFADYLLLVLSLLLAYSIYKRHLFQRIIYIPLFASGVILIIFTFSRGAWIGFGTGLFLFIFLKLLYSERKTITLLTSILLVFLVFMIIYSFKDPISHRVFGDDHGSAQSRIPMMAIGFEMIKANPFLGVGINNYTTVMANYDQIGLSYVWGQPVHNVFIQLTAEIGIPGLLIFLWFIVTLYFYALKHVIQSNEFFHNQLIGLITGITALFIHAMVNNATIATDPFILFWVFGGLIISIVRMNKEEQIKTNSI